MEKVLGGMNKVLLDGNTRGQGQGVVPYLPLNELVKPLPAPATGGSN
jgi:membrane protease subunit HflK